MTAATIGLFIYLVGLCVGSFLNVVVFRLPRGLSISKPIWSFCPHCQTTLRWYDNLPVLGWLLLGGRCRYCRRPISVQYPLVEAITGLVFVLAYHLLFVADLRVLRVTELGVEALATAGPTDVPLLLAWLVLAAALIACSAMDLLWYVVDTRVTDVALVAGIALYAIWPRPEFFAGRAATPAAAGAAAAFLISGLMMWRAARRSSAADEQTLGLETGDGIMHPPPTSASGRAATAISIVIFCGLAVWLLVREGSATPGTGGLLLWAVPAAFVALFVTMVLTGGQPREVDEQLRAAIEAEAPAARRAVLRELLWLTPAVGAAIVAYVVVSNVSAVADAWRGATNWAPVGRFTPLGGAVFAVHGAIIAAAAGWIVRIFFTLVFGREAFGTGDIYILAAAGAVCGWDIALLGFLFSVFIALLGWIVGLLLKRPGMIPFGPPLALGFFVALWLNRAGSAWADSLYDDFGQLWHRQPRMALLLAGIMLVVLPISIGLARLTRRLIEPQPAPPNVSPREEDT